MKMQLCFALLLDYEAHNFSRKLALTIHRQYHTGLTAASLPPHVSLGPGFEIDHPQLPQVEDYLGEISRRTPPFQIQFQKVNFKIIPDGEAGLGIIWLDVKDDKELRRIHQRLYAEINEFGWKIHWKSPEKYLFHSTISYGGQPGSLYQEIYDRLAQKEIQLTSNITQIAICCPPDERNIPGTYVTYQILPLGDRSSKGS